MNKKYDFFRTSDGHLWVAKKSAYPDGAGWNSRQRKFAWKTLVIGYTFVIALAGLLGIYAGYILKGAK